MRTLRLARVAAEAEGLRLRRRVGRAVIRIVLCLIALMWLSGTLVFAHIAVWNWLSNRVGWTPMGTAWALAGGDAVIGGVLLLVAAQLGPGRVEIEALAVRTRAIEAATASVAMSAMLMQVLRIVLNLVRRRRE